MIEMEEIGIEMDESEFAYSDYSAEALRIVLELLGPECKDKLLVSTITQEDDG